MDRTMQLRRAGQSIWLDNITRDLLTRGTLQRYIVDLGVTGLTSNPSIYDKAIGGTAAYDDAIARLAGAGRDPESIFFELAIDDLGKAADLFRPTYDRTNGVDGFVSLEVSPLLAHDADTTIRDAARLHATAGRPNLYIKIPGTPEGLKAIEESIFSGIPINVTLLFSVDQYLAAAEAYTRGIERRLEGGLNPYVPSVASVFISRWDGAMGELPPELHLQLGLAMGRRLYVAYRKLMDSDRWQRLMNEGAKPQRLLWASTGTKDPKASNVFYIEGLASPFTVNTMPEETLLAFADRGTVTRTLEATPDPADEKLMAGFRSHGVDVIELAQRLQDQGVAAFDRAWKSLVDRIEQKAGIVADAR
jgi:transaldolase